VGGGAGRPAARVPPLMVGMMRRLPLVQLVSAGAATSATAIGWRLPNVDWAASTVPLPTAAFATRAVDCVVWPADHRTYCYTDLVNYSNPQCPGSYGSDIGCFSSANPVAAGNWTYHGIVLRKGALGSVDSGGLATPSALVVHRTHHQSDGSPRGATGDDEVYIYFSTEGGPPSYRPPGSVKCGPANGPRGIGGARSGSPTGPFTRLSAPVAPAPPWPTNATWCHGPHPGGILDDSQVLEYPNGTYHLFHSRKLDSSGAHGCPVSHGDNACCVEWRTTSTPDRGWVSRGIVLTRAAPHESQPCEPMDARVYIAARGSEDVDTLVLLTDGDQSAPGWSAFVADATALTKPGTFRFSPAESPSLGSYVKFPVDVVAPAIRVMPKIGAPTWIGVATQQHKGKECGGGLSFTGFPLGPSPPSPRPVARRSFTVVGAGSVEWNGLFQESLRHAGSFFQVTNTSRALYASGGVWRLAVSGVELFYVAATAPFQGASGSGGATTPPLGGWAVARHCNLSAGLRPPACQASAGPVGGLVPPPHLVRGV
jgi:hypothetical protein